MSDGIDGASASTARGLGPRLLSAYRVAANNVSLTVVVAGLLVAAVGATAVARLHAVLAGMFGVWGVTLVLLGGTSFVLLRANSALGQEG